MPDGRIVIEMTGEEAKFFQSCLKAAAGMNKVEEGAAKLAKASRDAAKEEEAMGREGKRAYDQTRTPQEQYVARLERLNDLLRRGKIDQETYGRAAKKAGEDAASAGHKMSGVFSSVQGHVLGTVSALTGLTGGLATVLAVLDKMREAKREAAQKAREAEMGIGSLAQLTTDPKRYHELVEGAKQMHAQGGASSLDEAARTVFALESAGLFGQRKIFSDLKSQGLVSDTANMARATKTLITSMGADQTGDARQVLSKAFAAGTFAPSYAQELLPAAARAGTRARAVNVSDKELLAAVALSAEASGSAEMGGTRISALLKAIGRMDAKAGAEDVPAYSEEEFQRDKEALGKERESALSGMRRAARQDPVYRQQVRTIETEKARSKLPRRASPEAQAEHSLRMRDLADQERKALEDAETRAEGLPQFQNIASRFKVREEALIAKRKAAAGGIATDDEGVIVDDDLRKIRAAAGRAMAKAGPDLMSRLQAIKQLNLGEPQLQKLFGRSEGLEAFRVLLGNQGRYGEALDKVTSAERDDYVAKALKLPQTIKSQAAARSVRVEQGAEEESAEELGIGTNLFEAAQKRYYRLLREGKAVTKLPTELKIALHKVAEGTLGSLPGMKSKVLGEMYRAGAFNPEFDVPNDSGLKGQVEEFLGVGRPSNAPTVDLRGSQNVSQDFFSAMNKLNEAAAKLDSAADKMDRSRASRPTLAPANAKH